MMGLAYLNKNELEKAYQIFDRNMKRNPKNVASYYYTALIYAQTEDYNTAHKYIEKAIKVNRTYKPSYFLLARILKDQGMEKEAQNILDYVNSLP